MPDHFSNLKEAFPVTFVVNLPTREDRWDAFCLRMQGKWPFGKIIRFPAVNGHLAPPPSWWSAGEGAWGCYRSHVQILESCLTSGVERVLIMEDDAFLVDDFEDASYQFLSHLPHDWRMIYLGGQHLQQQLKLPTKINDWVYRPFNVNRTHCYALQGRETIEQLYKHLNEARSWQDGHHIDHHYGEWQKRNPLGVFVPRRWLVGQLEGLSSITYKQENQNLWLGAEELIESKIDRPTLAILGIYRGGTSCLAGMLHHLGINLGNSIKAPNNDNPSGFFEDQLLGEVCRNIFSEPWLKRKIHFEDSVSLLRWWASKASREATPPLAPLCGKHPILSMLVPELEQAWETPKFIALNRPLGDTANSLKRVGWNWPQEAIENVLPRMVKTRDDALYSGNSDHIYLEYNQILQNPLDAIRAICDFLDLAPSHEQIQSTLEFVHTKTPK